jgi:hypothetical protein
MPAFARSSSIGDIEGWFGAFTATCISAISS